jgi:hypothetical protein
VEELIIKNTKSRILRIIIITARHQKHDRTENGSRRPARTVSGVRMTRKRHRGKKLMTFSRNIFELQFVAIFPKKSNLVLSNSSEPSGSQEKMIFLFKPNLSIELKDLLRMCIQLRKGNVVKKNDILQENV